MMRKPCRVVHGRVQVLWYRTVKTYRGSVIRIVRCELISGDGVWGTVEVGRAKERFSVLLSNLRLQSGEEVK
jgi:hypothetical protein